MVEQQNSTQRYDKVIKLRRIGLSLANCWEEADLPHFIDINWIYVSPISKIRNNINNNQWTEAKTKMHSSKDEQQREPQEKKNKQVEMESGIWTRILNVQEEGN